MGWEWRQWSRSLRTRMETESRVGCMSGIFQFYRPLLFNSRQPTSVPDPNLQRWRAVHGGVETPRNSLDFNQTTASQTPKSTAGDEFHTPIKIYPAPESEVVSAAVKKMKKVLGEIEKSSSLTMTPRTSSVVARLMGLEQLPSENSTPRAHHHRPSSPPPLPQIYTHQQHNYKNQEKKQCRREPLLQRQPLRNLDGNIEEADLRCYDSGGSRSLPDTPRISTARSSWDSDPRLSLQLNKENSQYTREFNYFCELSAESSPSPSTLMASISCKSRKPKCAHLQLGENMSPSHCAREIVKQVKENVGRRITTSRGIGSDCTEDVRVKSSLTATVQMPAPEKNGQRAREDSTKSRSSMPPSRSPRVRFSEPLGTGKSHMGTQLQRLKPIREPSPPPPLPSPSVPFLLKAYGDPTKQQTKKMASPKCKKASSERFNERLRKPLMATSVCTSPPTTAAEASPLHTLLQKRTDTPPKATEAHKPPTKPTQESIKRLQRSVTLKATCPSPSVTTINKSKAPPAGPELEYVRSILDRTGIRREGCVTSARWYSPAHPVDPIIFHLLELSLSETEEEKTRLGPLRHRCNRKLLFHLVDEVLGDLLRPYLNTKPWFSVDTYGRCHGEVLVHKLGSRIRSFPAAQCRVMEDIDVLVEGDLPEDRVRRVMFQPSVREEVEFIALEVERDLLDSLVGEAAASLALLPLRGRRCR